MEFEKVVPVNPVSVGDIEIRLFQSADGSENKAMFEIQVLMSDGSIKVLQGDLIPYNTTYQNQQLLAFMNEKRAQAVNEIL
jgi:hypothetical protein